MVMPVHPPDGRGAGRGLKPHLIVRLRPGWRYRGRRRFGAADGGDFKPDRGDLPRGTRIVHRVPALARVERPLTEDEKRLARYLNILLPAGTDAAAVLRAVETWECVEEAQLPPEISLPEV